MSVRQGAQYLKAGRSPETLGELFDQERNRMLGEFEAAFRDETGLLAQEAELVEEDNGTWRRWFYRRREGAERAVEPEPERRGPLNFLLCLVRLREYLSDEKTRGEIAAELSRWSYSRLTAREVAEALILIVEQIS